METQKLFYIKTYGCQMNVYDSERVHEMMYREKYKETDNYQDADLIIINTCHIREKAAEKLYSELGRISVIKKEKLLTNGLYTIIAVMGCVGQAEGNQIFKRAPNVDIVLGPQSYHDLPKMLHRLDHKVLSSQQKNTNKQLSLDFEIESKFDQLPQERSLHSSSAFISVQEGCDKFCTFCVVPYTRGAEFSRPVQDIIEEAKQLVNCGAKEIYLLGQNVNAYHGLDEVGKVTSLGALIIKLAKIKEIERIRYTTSHPADMHDELYEAHASENKLMPFLHLPIQTGSNSMLKRMNRKHKVDEYRAIIEKLQIARSDMAFSSDFIVGFPGETDQDFRDTLKIIEDIKYTQCFSFKYSKRPGTPGAEYEDQVIDEVKSERLEQIQKLILSKQNTFNTEKIDQIMPVLFDRKGKEEGQIVGKSPYLQSVCVDNQPYDKYRNQIIPVLIKSAGNNSLKGVMLK